MEPPPRSGLSRRDLIVRGVALGAAGLAGCGDGGNDDEEGGAGVPDPSQAPTGITADTVAEAQRLAALEFDRAEREAIAKGAGKAADAYRRRRETRLANGLAPATVFLSLSGIITGLWHPCGCWPPVSRRPFGPTSLPQSASCERSAGPGGRTDGGSRRIPDRAG